VSKSAFTGFFLVPMWSSMLIIGRVALLLLFPGPVSGLFVLLFVTPHTIVQTLSGVVKEFLKNPSPPSPPRVSRGLCPWYPWPPPFVAWRVGRPVLPIVFVSLVPLWLQRRLSKVPVVVWFLFWYFRRNIRTSGGRLCHIANSYRYFSPILLVSWLGRRPVLRPLMPRDRAGCTGFYGPFLERPSVGRPSAFPPYS